MKRLIRRLLKLPGKSFYRRFSRAAVEVLDDNIISPEFAHYPIFVKGKMISFFCLNELTLRRAKHTLTKEPGTLAWIDSFYKGDVFWDIGANVGTYSLYASTMGIESYAFEPLADNYFILSRDLKINGLPVKAYNLAFDELTHANTLMIKDVTFGAAQSYFATKIDYAKRAINPVFEQPCLGFAIDDFIVWFRPSFPTHIKIDVDGNELKILRGMRHHINDKRLKSILVEWTDNRTELEDIFANTGLVYESRTQIEDTADGKFFNYIYRRAS